jgi:hypothetical protein
MQGSVLKLMKQFGGWLGKIGTKLKGFSVSFKNWPRLSKFINALLTPFRLLGKLVSGAGSGFGKLAKWLKPVQTALQKIIGPIVKVGGKLTGLISTVLGPIGTAKNAKNLSETMSKKGLLGRAAYSLMHMFTTIATFGYEFKEMVKAWWGVFADALKGVKDKFLDIVDGLKLKLIDMWNFIANSRIGKWAGMEGVETAGMKQDSAFKGIKKSLNIGDRDEHNESNMGQRLQKWKVRAEKVGVVPEEGDDYDSYVKRIQAAEASKKVEAQELPAQGMRSGAGPPGHGQALLPSNTISIQNQTFNNQMPQSSRESFSGLRVIQAN